MTRRKLTKRALLLSALSLLLCISMLIGTTYAWFTDSVTSGNNKIVAGTLKIDLELYDSSNNNNKWKSIKDSREPIFNSDVWAPGYTEVKLLKVENEGDLALKWKAKFASEDELSELAEVINVYVCQSEQVPKDLPNDCSLQDLEHYYNEVGTVKEFVKNKDPKYGGELKAGESSYLGIALRMQINAKDKYQGMDLGGEFDIQILATQTTSESDSFNKNYDKDAKYDENNVYIGDVKYNSIAAAVSAANDGDTIRLTAGTFDEALNLQGKALTIQGAGKGLTVIAGPEDYINGNIPMQSWAGWGNNNDDKNVYSLISANKDVTIKDLTVSAKPKQIAKVAQFRHQSDCAFVGIHVQSANATIENVNIKNIKPTEVTGNDHHNFGLYITSSVGDNTKYTVIYKNGKVFDVNRGGIYCWSDKYTLNFEKVTVVGPGSPENPNGTLEPAENSENKKAIYAFAPVYVYSETTKNDVVIIYKDVVIRDSWCVDWWGGASWKWADPAWATELPEGVTCINCGIAN